MSNGERLHALLEIVAIGTKQRCSMSSNTISIVRRLISLLALSLLVACGGSSGGGSSSADFSIESIATVDAQGDDVSPSELFIGHPVRVSIQAASNEATSEVGVVFWLQQLNDEDGVRLAVGGATFDLQVGSAEYVTEFVVPYGVPECIEFCEENTEADGDTQNEPRIELRPIPAGEYYLFAEMDPVGLIAETNEDNNIPDSATFPIGALLTTVRDDKAGIANIALKSLTVDISEPAGIVLDAIDYTRDDPKPIGYCGNADSDVADVIEDIANSSIGLTAVIDAWGSLDAATGENGVIPWVSVNAAIDFGGDVALPLRFWDNEAKENRDSILIPNFEPGESQSVYLDLQLNFDSEINELRSCLPFYQNPFNPFDGTISCIDNLTPDIPPTAATCLVNTAVNNRPSLSQIIDRDLPTEEEFISSVFEGFINCLDEENVMLKVALTPLDNNKQPITEEFEPVGIESDNELVVAVSLNPVPQPDPTPPTSGAQERPSSFSVGFDGSTVGVGINGFFQPGIDENGVAYTTVQGAVPVSIFDNDSVDLIGLNANARYNPLADTREFTIDLSVLGTVILPLNIETEGVECSGGVELFSAGGPDCPTMEENYCDDPTKTDAESQQCYKDCWAVGVTPITKSKQMAIGPVPLKVDFSVSATAGLTAEASLPCGISSDEVTFLANAGVYANLGSAVTATAGLPDNLNAGVGGTINLLTDTLYARTQIDLSKSDSEIFANGKSDFTNTLLGPNGKIYIFATATVDLGFLGEAKRT